MFFMKRDCNRTHDEESLRAPDPLDTETGNSSADNQPYLKNLHREYYDRQLKISQDSTQILEKDPSQVICKE